MRLAVMQPYFFPYLGYFHLIDAVDLLIFYDDVNYIKGGWVNRNKILNDNRELLLTVPLSKSSSFKKINETELKKPEYYYWKIKVLKSIDQAYKHATYYSQVREILLSVLNDPGDTISDLAKKSIISVLEYLDIEKKIFSSDLLHNSHLKSEERIIDICNKIGATKYINLIGGKDLYNSENFLQNNIDLKFISSKNIQYSQRGDGFVPNLSIIDVLMNNSRKGVKKLFKEYQLM